MNIAVGKRPTISTPTSAPVSLPVRVRNKNIPAGATVAHDAAKDCFRYTAPGHGYEVCRSNPLLNGLKAGAAIGIPSLLGAAEKGLFGTLGAGLGGTWLGLVGGVALGAGIGYHQAYEGSKKNPIMGFLGGVAGAVIGGIALPILKQPGIWGGLMGAAIATGSTAVGVGVWTAVSNHHMTQDAKAHGWTKS